MWNGVERGWPWQIQSFRCDPYLQRLREYGNGLLQHKGWYRPDQGNGKGPGRSIEVIAKRIEDDI